MKTPFVLLFAFFICYSTMGQGFDSQVTRITTGFGEHEAVSYSTQFDFSKEKVTKGFWKFSKAYGYAINYKSYFELTIPPDKNESNVSIKILGKAEDQSGKCRFYMGVKKEDIPDDVYNDLNATMKQLLLNFKRDFHIDNLEQKITSSTKQAVRMSKQYERSKKKKDAKEKQNELMSSLTSINDSILKLQQEKTRLASLSF